MRVRQLGTMHATPGREKVGRQHGTSTSLWEYLKEKNENNKLALKFQEFNLEITAFGCLP